MAVGVIVGVLVSVAVEVTVGVLVIVRVMVGVAVGPTGPEAVELHPVTNRTGSEAKKIKLAINFFTFTSPEIFLNPTFIHEIQERC